MAYGDVSWGHDTLDIHTVFLGFSWLPKKIFEIPSDIPTVYKAPINNFPLKNCHFFGGTISFKTWTWGKEGMPIELIAKVLEISVAAVKWSLERVDGVAAQVWVEGEVETGCETGGWTWEKIIQGVFPENWKNVPLKKGPFKTIYIESTFHLGAIKFQRGGIILSYFFPEPGRLSIGLLTSAEIYRLGESSENAVYITWFRFEHAVNLSESWYSDPIPCKDIVCLYYIYIYICRDSHLAIHPDKIRTDRRAKPVMKIRKKRNWK